MKISVNGFSLNQIPVLRFLLIQHLPCCQKYNPTDCFLPTGMAIFAVQTAVKIYSIEIS